jgi:hypothetical protein
MQTRTPAEWKKRTAAAGGYMIQYTDKGTANGFRKFEQ